MSEDGQLAIDGAVPTRQSPFSAWPFYDVDEQAAVIDVLRSGKVNYWTGDTVQKFEAAYAASLGVDYAIALANGTVALELGLRALQIGPGDEVIVTSRTFIASASCIVNVGAKPVFADVDADSQNLTAASIEAAITSNTKAVILVHLAGWPCDFDSILATVRKRGLKVIEDCAQAHGAAYSGAQVGSFGDLATFSFCQDKIITTGGEGGLLVTSSEDLWKRAWAYKEHGKNPEKVSNELSGISFRWLHDSIGTNWRMTAVQAAIGLCQLKKLPEWCRQRNRHAKMLREGLEDCSALRVPWPGADIVHGCYKFYAFIKPERLKAGWGRGRVLEALRAEGIPAASGSCSEVYLEKAFDRPDGRPHERLPVARELGETSVMLPVHPTLLEADVSDMVTAFQRVLKIAASD